MVGRGYHMRYQHIRVTVIGLRERLLRGGLQPVVELLGDPVAQFRQQRLYLQPGHQHAEEPAEAAKLGEVTDQRLPGARILDLHGHRAPVVPGGPGRWTPRRRACRRTRRMPPASPARGRLPGPGAPRRRGAAGRIPGAWSASPGTGRLARVAARPRRWTAPGPASARRP